jgi:hypothetical protein
MGHSDHGNSRILRSDVARYRCPQEIAWWRWFVTPLMRSPARLVRLLLPKKLHQGLPGITLLHLRHLLRRPLRDNLAAVFAAFGAEVD